MNIFRKDYRISASIIVLIILVILTIGAFIAYLSLGESKGRLESLFGSLAAGMIVAIVQFIIAWQDYKQTEKLKKLKLIEVMYNRALRGQYEDFIRNAARNLDVMGVTSVRFFSDFADTSLGAPDNATVLLQAMERGVHVRVLLPTDDYIPDFKKVDSRKVKDKYNELIKKYTNLEIRYFNHTAAHSIFRIDDTCIVGPVFPDLESRNTPALHVMTSSPIALNYLDYFEKEWNNAKGC